MVLLVDSGSTKTIWKIISDNNIQTFYTKGLNPYIVSEREVKEAISSFSPLLGDYVKEIYFYGSGCGNNDIIDNKIRNPLKEIFPLAKIEIHNDLLACARGIFNKQEGLVCILGTGSNATYYNGKECISSIPSLGYILGDEGSGSYIAKQLIKKYYYGQFSETTLNQLKSLFPNTLSEILENVYQKEMPNKYLGSFMNVFKEITDNKEIKHLILDAFNAFFEIYVVHYPEHLPIAFTGGVAFHFQEELYEVANQFNRNIAEVVESPMEGLIKYHLDKIII